MNGAFEKLTTIIEGSDFRFALNIATGLKMFIRLLKTQETFKLLAEFARSEGYDKIEERIEYLLSMDTNPEYEHPFDTAIAAYLTSFKTSERKSILTLSKKIAKNEQLWWGRRIAREIITEAIEQSINETLQYLQSSGITTVVDDTQKDMDINTNTDTADNKAVTLRMEADFIVFEKVS